MHELKAAPATTLSTVALLICAVGGPFGCASQAAPPRAVYDGPELTVTLRTLPTGTLRATHPITLSDATLAPVLAGVRVVTDQRLMQTLFGGDAAPTPAFEPATIRRLARAVSHALAQAGPDDYVRFETRRAGARGEERTGGSLYVRGGAVVLAFTDVGRRPGPGPPKGKAGGGAPLAAVGPTRSVAFEPRGVELPLDDAPPAGLGSSDYRPLAIDYRLAAKLSRLAPTSVPSGPPEHAEGATPPAGEPSGGPAARASSADVQALKDLVIQKDLEIEALRREVEQLKQSLGPSGTTPRR